MKTPPAVDASSTPERPNGTSYPEPFRLRLSGRTKRPLGDVFGLTNFGVNLVQLQPGGRSTLRHAHSRQDEFVYVLSGRPTLHTDEGATLLAPGMCAGFRAGSGNGHCLTNESDEAVTYLEVGDRTAGDRVSYPDDDLLAAFVEGQWLYAHKDGTPY